MGLVWAYNKYFSEISFCGHQPILYQFSVKINSAWSNKWILKMKIINIYCIVSEIKMLLVSKNKIFGIRALELALNNVWRMCIEFCIILILKYGMVIILDLNSTDKIRIGTCTHDLYSKMPTSTRIWSREAWTATWCGEALLSRVSIHCAKVSFEFDSPIKIWANRLTYRIPLKFILAWKTNGLDLKSNGVLNAEDIIPVFSADL